MPLKGSLGEKPIFTLQKPLRVQKGRVIALTLPTWAPLYKDGLDANANYWKASRKSGECGVEEVPDAKPQLRKGSTRTYGCKLTGERILYWAYFVPEEKQEAEVVGVAARLTRGTWLSSPAGAGTLSRRSRGSLRRTARTTPAGSDHPSRRRSRSLPPPEPESPPDSSAVVLVLVEVVSVAVEVLLDVVLVVSVSAEVVLGAVEVVTASVVLTVASSSPQPAAPAASAIVAASSVAVPRRLMNRRWSPLGAGRSSRSR